jgi:hypothetical protein
MLIVTEDDGGSTSESLHIWKENRHLFGVFTEARVYSRGDGALIDGRLFKKHRLASPPSMILVDDRGNELWLTGTPCGYVGTGSGGAATILHEEGFGDDSEAVVDDRVVKVVLRKGEDGAIASELTERGATLWDGDEKIVRWLWGQAQVGGSADRAEEVARLLSRDPLYRQGPM